MWIFLRAAEKHCNIIVTRIALAPFAESASDPASNHATPLGGDDVLGGRALRALV